MLLLPERQKVPSMKSLPSRPEGTPLTERQWQVARLVALGRSTREIGTSLNISPRTVKEHVREAARRVPGDTTARHRLIFHVLSVEDRQRDRSA